MSDDDRPLFERPLDALLPPDKPPQRFSIKNTSRKVYDLPDTELVAIARLQKWMLICFLVPFLLFLAACLIAFGARRDGAGSVVAVVSILMGGLGLALAVASYVFRIMLLVKLFQPRTVALFICLDLLCGAGVITLLIINGRATSTLKRNGIRVGLFGARNSDLPKVVKRETTMPRLGW